MKTHQQRSPLPINKDSLAQLRLCERRWLKARERLISLAAQKEFWFGSQSAITWLMAQMVSYVVILMLAMLMSKLFVWPHSGWLYLWLFLAQPVFFILLYIGRAPLQSKLQSRMTKYNRLRAQALADMHLIATIEVLRDIHKHTPLSLRDIDRRYEQQIQMVSLHRILQKEVEENRMRVSSNGHDISLPPEFAEDQLHIDADKLIYRSLLTSASPYSHQPVIGLSYSRR